METQTMDNLKMIAETAKDFAEKNIRPNIMDWDESQTFPVELFHQLGELGFMGIVIPEEYGGSGLGYQEYVTILDEISQVATLPSDYLLRHTIHFVRIIFMNSETKSKEENGFLN